MTWGAATGESDFVLCKFDLGVGGAIVRDSTVVRGVSGSAAEFGHIVLDPEGSHTDADAVPSAVAARLRR
jgi:predicted NBD/HSP70 family sugar kinase